MPEIHGQSAGAVAVDLPLHGEFTDVVGRYREQPVPVELVVQRLQVVECGARRFDHVAPAVVPPILLQAETHAGARNELPKTRRTAVRIREGFISAFDDRQQREFQRHAARLDLGHDVVHVALRALKRALEVIRVVLEPAQLLIDGGLLSLFEHEACAHAIEQVVVVLAVVMLPFLWHCDRRRRRSRRIERRGARAPDVGRGPGHGGDGFGRRQGA